MKTEFDTDLCRLKSKLFFGKVVALRILVGLARAIRRQIGNTELVGVIVAHLKKNTAF